MVVVVGYAVVFVNYNNIDLRELYCYVSFQYIIVCKSMVRPSFDFYDKISTRTDNIKFAAVWAF